MTKYLDCGSICHCRAVDTVGLFCRDVYISDYSGAKYLTIVGEWTDNDLDIL